MNVTFFVVLIILIGGGLKGYKRGIVNEISSIIGLIAACIVIGFFVVAVKGYMEHETMRIVLGIVCLIIAMIIHHIMEMLLTSVRMLFHLPVVSGLDRCLGFLFGVLEMIVLVQILFIVLVAFEFGGIKEIIQNQIAENEFLTYLYGNNYPAKIISQWFSL